MNTIGNISGCAGHPKGSCGETLQWLRRHGQYAPTFRVTVMPGLPVTEALEQFGGSGKIINRRAFRQSAG
jgi:hypothetical protein